MELNEALRLDEYIKLVEKGKINMDYLEVSLMILSSKESARRLAFHLLDYASPQEVEHMKRIAHRHSNIYIDYFLEALKERKPVKVS